MTNEKAKEYAKNMSYRDAVYNALQGRCIPYHKATLIKLCELLDMIESQESKVKITNKDAINILYGIRAQNLNLDDAYTKDKFDALTMAIELLKKEVQESEVKG